MKNAGREGGDILRGRRDAWLITRSLLRARIHLDARDVCDGSCPDPSDIPPFAVKASYYVVSQEGLTRH